MFDIRQKVADEYGDYNERKVQDYIDDLMEEFDSSPEAESVLGPDGPNWSGLMAEYGFTYLSRSPAEMSLPDFNEVVFQLFPEKVSTEADSAAEIIKELRAFWQFVKRQYGLDNASQILLTLDASAEKRLRKKLADPANYGMAKSFVMQGMEAGFDMTTQEGMDQFMQFYNSQLLGSNPGLPPPIFDEDDEDFMPFDPDPSDTGPSPRARHDERRKARKRQRQARKRNRKK